jgi:hypothetical protein
MSGADRDQCVVNQIISVVNGPLNNQAIQWIDRLPCRVSLSEVTVTGRAAKTVQSVRLANIDGRGIYFSVPFWPVRIIRGCGAAGPAESVCHARQ